MSSAPSSQASELEPRPAPHQAAALIPAYGEATTVASIVNAALAAELGEVWVIDDGSTDDTAAVAEAAGAKVIRLSENRGKGGALEAGARAAREDVVVLLDADLLGLSAEHVRALAAPVISGEVDMTRGVFAGGRLRTTLAQRVIPQLNGQRALRRLDLLGVPHLAASRYGVEVAITRHAIERGWRFVDVPLTDVSQVMKEEKRGLAHGLVVRARMYWEILRAVIGGRGG